MNRLILFVFFCICLPVVASASEDTVKLKRAHIDPTDKASLQRGAKWFMNYCQGCHSLKYLRYNRMAKDIGITGKYGRLDVETLQKNLIFSEHKISDTIPTPLAKNDGAKWFGVSPPDLTLVTRVRGKDWVYSYLLGFYEDPKATWGVNNRVFKDVAMPNVLENLQGMQKPLYHSKNVRYNGGTREVQVLTKLELSKKGTMTKSEFRAVVTDLVNFLDYVAEPMKLQRKRMGWWVLGFLAIMLVLTYMLKKEFWRDID